MLSQLQQRIARVIASLEEADGFALAGGSALVVHEIVSRTMRDLDYFSTAPDDVDRLLPVLVSRLGEAELHVVVETVAPGSLASPSRMKRV